MIRALATTIGVYAVIAKLAFAIVPYVLLSGDPAGAFTGSYCGPSFNVETKAPSGDADGASGAGSGHCLLCFGSPCTGPTAGVPIQPDLDTASLVLAAKIETEARAARERPPARGPPGYSVS
jgi:hypothetical protein